MNRMKLLATRIPLITALIFVLVNSAFPPPAMAQEDPSGFISFQPSVIPDIRMRYEDYTFKFQLRGFFMRVAPFVIYGGEYYGLKEIIQWLQNTYPQVSYSWLLQKARNMIHYGFNLTQLPQKIADKVDYLGFRLVDLNFPLSWLRLEHLNISEAEEPYTLSRIHIEGAHLVLSFEDLYPYGYTVTHVNSTWLLIGGVKGKRNLYCDPILYSSGVITVNNEAVSLQDIADEDLANGWNIFRACGSSENKCYVSGAKLVLTNSSSLTDSQAQIIFNSSCVSGNAQILITVETGCNLTFGTLLNATARTSRNGLSFVFNNADGRTYTRLIAGASGSTIYLYSSYFQTITPNPGYRPYSGMFRDLSNARIWNCILDQTYPYACGNLDLYRLTVVNGYYGLGHSTIAYGNDLLLCENQYNIRVSFTQGATLRNVVGRDPITAQIMGYKISVDAYLINADMDTWSFSWVSSTAQIWRQYEYDLTVLYENGSLVEGASVEISHYGQGYSQDYSGLTGSNGSIPTQVLSMGFYNQTGASSLYSHNPYHLSIVKGDHTYGGNFTLSEKTSWDIILQDPEEAPSMGPFYHSHTIDYGAALMIRAPERVEPSLPQYLSDIVPISVDIQLLNRLGKTRNLGLRYNITGPEGELILEGSLEENLDPNSQEELTLAWEVPLRKKEAPKNYTLSIQVLSGGRILGDPVSYVITVAQSSWAPLYVLALLGIVCVVAVICYGGYRLVRREE